MLKNISFQAERGSRIGIYGANGSGKSTLLRILAGLLNPDSGQVSKQERGQIQFCPADGGGFLLQLNGRQNLEFWFSLHGKILRVENPTPMLEQALTTPYSLCSSGMRQFLGIYKALTLKSNLLLLDEPFTHLDMDHREWVRNELKKNSSRITVISGHSRAELETVCDTIYELKNGVLV